MLEKSIMEFKNLTANDGLVYALRFIAESVGRYLTMPLLNKIFYSHLKGVSIKRLKNSDIKLYVKIEDVGISQELLRFGNHEPLSTKIFLDYLEPYMKVLDAGANLGYFALQEAKVAKHVYAVEPIPENFKLLKNSIRLNGFSNIEASNIAFSDRNGTLNLYQGKASNWASAYKTSLNVLETVTVPCMTIDSFLHGREVNVVRMDVEGYEVKIVEGMKETLSLPNLLLFVEVHPIVTGKEACRQFLEKLAIYGFKPACIVVGNRNAKIVPVFSMKEIANSPYLMSRIFHGFFYKGKIFAKSEILRMIKK